jgi:glyoxylase-like metal-dependent hydrolase (beta-lactamase superfamily II)
LFEQDQRGSEFYIVLEGSIEISYTDVDGVRNAVAYLEPGEFFGKMALLDGNLRSGRATAIKNGTRLLVIDHGKFIYLIYAQPAFALHLLKRLSARLRPEVARTSSSALPRRHTEASSYTMSEVANGILMLRSRNDSSNSYLLRGPRRTVLVDCGLPSSGGDLADTLGRNGVPLDSIETLVLTHEHVDHVGGRQSLRAELQVMAHRLTAAKVSLRDEFGMMCSTFSESLEPYTFEKLLEAGEIIDTGLHQLQVIYTPGHSSGSISLYDENTGLIISGDLFLANGTIGGVYVAGSPSDSIVSLNEIASLSPKLALPGHGPSITSPSSAIDKALANWHDLLQQSHAMFSAIDSSAASGRIVSAFQEMNRKWLKM